MRRGSITLQLCLVLGLILSLVLYSIRSVRIADGRVQISCAAEQSLYSLFAQYDRDLYEDYGLLFLDGGYSGRDLQLGTLCREVEEAAEYLIDPDKDRLFSAGTALSGLELTGCELTGYLLATDQDGAAFRRQICKEMADMLGVHVLEALKDQLTEQTETAERQEKTWESADAEEALKTYESLIRRAEGSRESGEADAAGFYGGGTVSVLTAETETEEAEVPEDFENPIEIIRNVRKMGLLSAAVPDPSRLSGYALEQETLPSRRVLQRGMGIIREEEQGSLDKVLLLEYLVENFSCYTSEQTGEGLRYQVEYAIGGKDNDLDNLKSVLSKLLLIREASNFSYLMADSGKSAQADQTAAILSTLLLMPEMKELVSLVIKLCWAYGESIMDLRELLDGGKIPLKKDEDSWQLSLGSLAGMLFGWEGERKSSSGGLDYTGYLRLLLFLESSESLTASLMDMTEYHIRTQHGRPDFSLDSCLEVLEIRLSGRVDRKEIYLIRSYGYDMEE